MALCPQCGHPLAEGLTEGLCSRCLMLQGLKLARTAVPQTPPVGCDLPRFCGDYELIEEIARGGMGVIYRARQQSLNRTVAVKMLLFGPHAKSEYVKRFRAEASAAATLQHPNIVAIHEVGVHQGEHYMVMDLVDGPNLANFTRNQPLHSHRAASYLKSIAEAIHYAHEHGILHRDLKPSNVLIDSQDQPRVTDFGLAKRLDADSSLTLTGQMLGSPNYMPPEQAGTSPHKIGRCADVYSLGAILYHSLVGRPPFVGEGLSQTLDQVFHQEPVAPRLLNPAVPADLETICLKCLEKEPARRYPTAHALADELGRFLRNEPIKARPLGRPERAWRWCRRKPALAALVLLLPLAVALGLAGILWQWRRAEQNLYAANVHRANEALEANDLPGTQLPLDRIDQSPVQRAMRDWTWRYLIGRTRQDEAAILDRRQVPMWGVAVSRDGQSMAAIGEDGIVKLWDTASRRQITNWLAHSSPSGPSPDGKPHALVFTPDGRTLVTAGYDDRVRFWDVPSGRAKGQAEAHDVLRLAISPDGHILAAGSGWGGISLWHLTDGSLSLLHRWHSQLAVLSDIAFAPDGRSLFIGGPEAQSVRRYDISDPTVPRSLSELEDSDGPMAVSPDGIWLAAARRDGQPFRVWALPSLELVSETRILGSRLQALRFSPDSQELALGLADGRIVLCSMKAAHRPVTLLGHDKPVLQVDFSSDGKTLISASFDQTVRVWDTTVGERGRWRFRTQGNAQDVTFSPDSKRLVSVSQTFAQSVTNAPQRMSVVQLWDVDERKGLVPGIVVTNAAKELDFGASFSPDGTLVAVDENENLRFLKVPTLAPDVKVGSRLACWAREGRSLVYYDRDKIVRSAYPGASARELVRIENLNALALSPNGRILAGCGHTTQWKIQFWDAQNGQPLGSPLSGHEAWVSYLAFSPDGNTLVSAGWDDGKLGIWDAKKRRLRALMPAHNRSVSKVAFSPDGATLATCGSDETVRLWNLDLLQEVAVLQGHDGLVHGVAFSPDCRWLASASMDGTIRLWRAPTLEEVFSKKP